MHDTNVSLPGLNGANPLAFLAALGVLRLLDFRARRYIRPSPALSWAEAGGWQPVLHGIPSVEAVIGEILEDMASWQDDPAFLIAYEGGGERLVDPRIAKGKIVRDLKPKPKAMRTFLENLASRAASQSVAEILMLRRSLDTAAAYGSEVVQDSTKGNIKPTAFHFTAGQQQFMKAVAELQAGVTEADLREALVGPWLRESVLPNMGWDATNARFYALRATDPSTDKKTTIAGADWLAFVGIGMLPSFPDGNRLHTTGVKGGWKDSTFTWPIWDRPATRRVAYSLLRTPGLQHTSASARRARSIAAVFSAGIIRSDQGGYGSFTPAEVC